LAKSSSASFQIKDDFGELISKEPNLKVHTKGFYKNLLIMLS